MPRKQKFSILNSPKYSLNGHLDLNIKPIFNNRLFKIIKESFNLVIILNYLDETRIDVQIILH